MVMSILHVYRYLERISCHEILNLESHWRGYFNHSNVPQEAGDMGMAGLANFNCEVVGAIRDIKLRVEKEN